MEYERIHKAQVGVLSPTKLRMKLIGAHNRTRKAESSSSRSSPSKTIDSEYAQNSLLARETDDEESSRESIVSSSKLDGPSNIPKNVSNSNSNNLSMIHPVRTLEEDRNGYESTGSSQDSANTCTFEFHRTVERAGLQNQMAGNCSRPVPPSKWNDAEKWIIKRQNSYSNNVRKLVGSNAPMSSCDVRVVNKSLDNNNNSNNNNNININNNINHKRVEFPSTATQSLLERFSFVTHQSNRIEPDKKDLPVTRRPGEGPKVTPVAPPVTTRDIGTEMTPIPSQDPSRTGTPLDSITPTRSPNSSVPSTPLGEKIETNTSNQNPSLKRKGSIKELSERELKIKTRKEIAALGVQLGKMRIASWASKEEIEMNNNYNSNNNSPFCENKVLNDVKKEYETQAMAWQEAENSRHNARFKREEVTIQVWESHQRAKFEAEILKVEAKAERMRAEAAQQRAENIEILRRTAEEKRAEAEARMNRQTARAARKAERIRHTGRVPPSHILLCCSGFF